MTNDESELARYKRFRETGMALNALLLKRLSRGNIKKCGKDIGLLVNGALVFHSEHETSILNGLLYSSQRTWEKVIH